MTRDTPSSQVEVYGRSVQALVDAMEFLTGKVQRVLASHGIASLDPEKWYPMSAVLDSFDDILKQVGPHTTRAIGLAIPKNAVFPPGIDSFESALLSLDQAYRMNHRGSGDIGSYRYQRTGELSAQMVCDNPYPCEFDQGIILALYGRFQPKGSYVLQIEHETADCRKTGAVACVYRLKW
ncbi:MAG TPA: hypothetical protein VF794_40520 [Archangium sp.]|jgi:hypothetical protein|uniref:hypothetical protein n=1 Tax=Archangium sp. TaxID=1872627 RepID=UPI002EDB545B